MKLPHRDEISQLRAQVESGAAAMQLNQLMKAAWTALSIVELQHGKGLPVPQMIPGEDVVDAAAAAFPGLAQLGSVGSGATTYETRLRGRKQQLKLATDYIEPLVAQVKELASELHDLQHKQRHELEGAQWAEAVAELRELATGRDQLSVVMSPLRAQIAHVAPVREMLMAFHPQLQAELIDAARTDDPDGRIAWRAAVMAHSQLVGLAEVIGMMGLALALPIEPALPDTPHPRHRRRLRAEAGAVLEWMVELSHALLRHGDLLQERLDGLELEHDKYELALKERMG